MVRDHADFGEPIRLTLRQVSAGELEPESPTTIFCCENPAVVATAADRLGEDVSHLVCFEGVPSTAGLVLLERLAAAGCPAPLPRRLRLGRPLHLLDVASPIGDLALAVRRRRLPVGRA